MRISGNIYNYFPSNVPISRAMWERLHLGRVLPVTKGGSGTPEIMFVRQVADSLNRLPERSDRPVPAGLINLFGLQQKIFRYLIDHYTVVQQPGALAAAAQQAGADFSSPAGLTTLERFAELFPGTEILAGAASPPGFVAGDDRAGTRKNALARELLLLFLAEENPAVDSFRELFEQSELASATSCGRIAAAIDRELSAFPPVGPFGMTLPYLLRAPLRAAPHSLADQLGYMRSTWRELLPPDLIDELLTSLDIIAEEEREWWSGPGKPQVLEFLTKGPGGHDYPDYERFSADADWMANVVMIAKMTYVWLGQLSKKYGRLIHRLDQIPDEELDLLARWGFTGLWLIGLWERSDASQRIKQIGGNPDAISSAYSLYDYVIADDLGGAEALAGLKERCARRGIRLASDMVPNHTGIYSKWTVEHPDWFIQLDYPPYPDYAFSGPDLSSAPEVSLQIEDGYWDRSNAAVVFRHHDHRDGRTRYIYHGNDGTSTPWNDTAQLNYMIPEVREAVIQTILHVARQFPIIRFDAAMTLAKKHFQRLWYPQPGHGSGIPSRAEHGMSREAFDAVFPEEFWREVVDRVAAEVPDTLLLAEAFWLMEGYFVRTLGMHRVYNSAFMNMLKMEENAKYRQTLKNVLEYDHRILQRFVNFMNNPDERTAVEQFGKEGKYFGAAVLLVTMPGLPMFGHGQIEGFHEKYGMEYKRAYWDEPEDSHLVRVHEEQVFPLMRRRRLFSGSADFVLYDFHTGDQVNEDVFAYSNRVGEERGIVLYHNRYAETSGWIRISAAMAVDNGEGETDLVRKSLGEALGFNPDGRCYYAFRDSVSGLEYLRAGRELCDKGLHAELASYEYRVFLDFREISDDDYGTWGKLCHNLQGRPVASIDEEVKQVRFGGVITAFRAAVAAVSLILASEESGKEELEQAGALLELLYEDLNRYTACTGNSRAVAGAVVREIEAARLLALPGVELASERLLLAAWLVLHGTGKLALVEEHAPVAAAWFGELGIDRTFAELVRETPAGAEAGACSLILKLMLRWQGLFAGWDGEKTRAGFTLLFADHDARDFLGVHTYRESEWFVKERFELLLARLLDVELIQRAVSGAGELSAAALLRKELHTLEALAAEAGYRADRFLSLLKMV
jgi:glycosidase